MFDLGGLKDQGETVDRKSRNKVPVGSLKKEVRDDVPINISEGEFVFPADVVRYHGLEKIMNMRQDAKAGLDMMNRMGQMGNSDQATLPDDIPFQPKNFQQGGINIQNPQVQNPQIIPDVQQTNQVPGVNVAPPQQLQTRPSVYTQQQQQPVKVSTPSAPSYSTFGAPQYKAPTSTAATPDYSKLVGAQFGQLPKSETKRYFNEETGEELYIPFIDGKPVYPIPAGFKEKAEIEKEKEKEDPTKSKVDTAKVREDTGDDGGFTTPDTPEYKVASTLASQKGGAVGDALGKVFKAGPIGIVTGFLDDKFGGKDAAGETFSSVAGMFPTELDQAPSAKAAQDAQLEALARQATSYTNPKTGRLENIGYAELTQQLGTTPKFEFGTKTGTISRDTGKFFDDTGGSANWDTGQVAYQSFGDFIDNMKASAKSGWNGGVGYSKQDFEKFNAKQQQLYTKHVEILGKKPSWMKQEEDDKKPKDTTTVTTTQKQTEPDPIDTITTTTTPSISLAPTGADYQGSKDLSDESGSGIGAGSGLDDSSSSFDTSSFDSGDDYGDSGGDAGYGDTSADVGGWTASGGFINRRTMTKSKMPPNKKRGGLASRK